MIYFICSTATCDISVNGSTRVKVFSLDHTRDVKIYFLLLLCLKYETMNNGRGNAPCNKWSSVKSNPPAHTAVMYNIPKQNISFRLELREK